MQLLAMALDVQPVKRLYWRGGLAFGGAKGGEVAFANEALRGPMHGGGIERARDAPGVPQIQREIGAPVDDAVAIVALDRRGAGVEIAGDTLGRQDRDRVRP